MTFQSRTAVAALIAILLAAPSASADTIALWTFESNTDPTANNRPAEAGSGTASVNTNGTISSPAGPGSAKSFSSNGWDVNEYLQFSTSTLGFRNIAVSWDQTGSDTGPKNFSLAYSVNGTSFTEFASYQVANEGWSSTGTDASYGGDKAFDLTSISALNGAATVYFRLIDTSTTAINPNVAGTPVGTAGTSRVDNFTITGDPVPLPAAATAGTLLLGALTTRRRTR